MNIIEKAVEKLEAEVEDLLKQENEPVGADTQQEDRRSTTAHAASRQRGERVGASASTREHVDAGIPPQATAAPSGVADSGGATRSESVVLDLEGLGAAGYVTPTRDQSLLAEEFRILKRPLLARAAPGDTSHGPHGNLIIITSSLPGEGKTFNALNLAFSMAMEVDRTVLLVDADVAKSDVSNILGIGERRGLSNYLDGSESDLSKLIVRTNFESLAVLPSGPRHPRITELLASTQMRELVQELSTRYPERIVIFDSPPLLATSGASVLAGLMGQVVMVVEAVRTSQANVREAIRRLSSREQISIVFNKERRRGGGRYGYYGYGDYGGYGGGEPPATG